VHQLTHDPYGCDGVLIYNRAVAVVVCLLALLVPNHQAMAADLPIPAGSYFDSLNFTSLTGRLYGGSFTVKRLTVNLCQTGKRA
jgi:hypothetical protein